MELLATITLKGHMFDGKAPEIVRKELLSAMYLATQFLETKVKENLPTEMDGHDRGVGVYGNDGGLRGSIHGEVDPTMLYVKGIIGHGKDIYGDIVELGRGPGPVKKGVLVRWIEVKFDMTTEQAQKAEFGFRQAISKKGFKGVHMFKRAFNDNFNELVNIFDKSGFKIAKAL
jgi:hypothetical protein